MTVKVKEILDKFDRLAEPEKIKVAAVILQRLTKVSDQTNSGSKQDWSQLVLSLAGSWEEDCLSLEQIREDS